ncbi:hypothetical protein, partial [Achromobacter denitrificans]|uniref:hypothetical protein n=1 Tax=Achromobacter denitrificans TaxID=32002 RepID=UPI003B9AE13C
LEQPRAPVVPQHEPHDVPQSFVGWVERGSSWARTQVLNARNPCGRGQTVFFRPMPGAQSARGRMGFARWRAVF